MKRITSLLVALIVGVAFSGTSLAQDGTLKKIKETGVIKIGNRDASIPFSYLDDKQNPIGYSIDLCMAIVEEVKKELTMPTLMVKWQMSEAVTAWRSIPARSASKRINFTFARV